MRVRIDDEPVDVEGEESGRLRTILAVTATSSPSSSSIDDEDSGCSVHCACTSGMTDGHGAGGSEEQ